MKDMPWNAISNLVTGVINTAVDGAQNAKNLEWQKEMFARQQDFEKEMAKNAQDFEKAESELAFEREKEMWNMQNAYNTPHEQMKRYQDAGLSPYLIYGQGTPGNATDSPSYQPTKATKPETLTPPTLPTFKSSLPTNVNWLENRQILSQVKANEAIEGKARAEEEGIRITNDYKARKEALETHYQYLVNLKEQGIITGQELKNQMQSFENQLFKDTYKARVKQIEGNADLTEANVRKVSEEAKNINIQNYVADATKDISIENQKAMLKLSQEKVNETMTATQANNMNNQILQEKLGKERAERLIKQLEAEQRKEFGKIVNPYVATFYMDVLHSINETRNSNAAQVSAIGEVVPF